MVVLTVVGARPQFIKAAAVSPLLRESHREWLLHTGQHYDDELSGAMFRDVGLPTPDECLHVGSDTHGAQTGRMLVGIEAAVVRERPDMVLIYGDTNSTLAGALAAAKRGVPVAHVEAGLRSFSRAMPEEINRVVADRLASLHFCPSEVAVQNLAAEGIHEGVHLVGDVMHDVLSQWLPVARERSLVLERFELQAKQFLLATVHRAENTDDPERLAQIIGALGRLNEPVILPLHPRTRHALAGIDIPASPSLRVVEALGYLDMLRLEEAARLILTDSGGVQKEAYWLGVPCVTLRDETEWVETVNAGWNCLAGADARRIAAAVADWRAPATQPPLYGDGHAAARIVELLRSP
ncbi:MAG: non-hydrolyzing UDP-N-acetylglucosamine 2-epimerase [Acidobacteriota bacterium]